MRLHKHPKTQLIKLRYKKAIKLSNITIVTSHWKFYQQIDLITYYCKVLFYVIWKNAAVQ